ncbi:MAG: SprT family zinc-dependent metalloprotease [Parcubacteria group bacterium]
MMNKEIIINDRKVSYNLRKSRRSKNMKITIHCDGNCVVSAPQWISNSSIEKFIFEKARWIIEKIEAFQESGIGKNKLLHQRSKIEYKQNKEVAFNLVKEKLENFNAFYDFSYGRISIRNQKTRWGSCSKSGNLNFNYKLIFLPEKLADYIIVHELCHLKEFNHSRRFWNLVAKTFPDWREIKREMRKM